MAFRQVTPRRTVADAGTRSEVRIDGVVQLRTALPADSMVPIGWAAVGDPARILPPGDHSEIWEVQKELDFPGQVFGLGRPGEGRKRGPFGAEEGKPVRPCI
ncbi:hypothetical protein [Streptomyces sp. NPDC053367]|uniref:hypothetical protein n=1 Tax=Streptomyces sp. NPDC053367 TaxID=3365700 RepID=UPI0037D68C76